MRAHAAALIGVSFEGPTVLAMHARTLALSAMVLAFAAACGGQESPATDKPAPPTGTEAAPRELPQGGEPVTLDPADFTNQVDNPYWPMAPGSRWVYRESDAEGAKLRVEVTVTSKKKRIMGIDALVVHDVVSEDGQPSRTPTTGTPRARPETSGTSARTRRSTRTARSSRPSRASTRRRRSRTEPSTISCRRRTRRRSSPT